MTQRWISSTEAGALRFVSRRTFALISWPQPPCLRCPWTTICRDLLADPVPGDVWLVRDRLAATSDGRPYDRCARDYTDARIPVDVVLFRHHERATLLEFVGIPGTPAKRPREARAGHLVLVPLPLAAAP